MAPWHGLRKDFGCTFISASSGSLEQALSRHRGAAGQWIAAQTKWLHLTHKDIEGRKPQVSATDVL